MGNNKWVNVAFGVAGLILIFVLIQLIDWIWGYFGKSNDMVVIFGSLILASGATFMAWRNVGVHTRVNEVVQELLKVTWPTRKETYAATVVVIVTVIIFSLFLGFFDFVWSWATDKIYNFSI